MKKKYLVFIYLSSDYIRMYVGIVMLRYIQGADLLANHCSEKRINIFLIEMCCCRM